LSLSDSNKYFSSASLQHAGVTVAIIKLRCFTSSGRTASAPYISQNGKKFVALHTVVLWLRTAWGMTSTHFPFFLPSRIFLIASNIRPLVHRCKCNLRSNLVVEVHEHCIVKIFCVVDSDVPWYTIAADDVLSKELFD
jgi:hypothetical protein